MDENPGYVHAPRMNNNRSIRDSNYERSEIHPVEVSKRSIAFELPAAAFSPTVFCICDESSEDSQIGVALHEADSHFFLVIFIFSFVQI